MKSPLLLLLLLSALPVSSQYDIIDNFRSAAVSCDYLIITPPEFVSNAALLAWHRNNFAGDQVQRAKVAILDSVLARFPDTSDRPTRLRAALMWAVNNWASPGLRYVVLIGDDSLYLNPADSTWHSAGHMPEWLSRPMYGKNVAPVAGDLAYGIVNDTFAQTGTITSTVQFEIGRIPCENNQQLATYVSKLVSYDMQGDSGSSKNRVLAIADDCGQGLRGADPICYQSTTFQSYCDLLLDRLSGWFVNKFYLSRYIADSAGQMPGGRRDLVEEINRNNYLTLFEGHGAPNVLADEQILTGDAVDTIQNTSPGIFLFLTSSAGSFDVRTNKSIAKRLLFKAAGGAIGIVGSNELTYFESTEIFGRHLLSTVTENQPVDLGGALVEAYNADPSSGRPYLLLGDPAATIHGPTINFSSSIAPGVVVFNSTVPDSLSYVLHITVRTHFTTQNPMGRDFDYDSIVYTDSGRFQAGKTVTIPDVGDRICSASTFAWDAHHNEGRSLATLNSSSANNVLAKAESPRAHLSADRQSIMLYVPPDSRASSFYLMDLQGKILFSMPVLKRGAVERLDLPKMRSFHGCYVWQLRVGNEHIAGRIAMGR